MIRPYHPDDLEDLRVCVFALQDYESTINPLTAPGEAMIEPYLRELFSTGDTTGSRVFVKEIDARVVGFVAVQARVANDEIHEVGYNFAYISELVVLPEFRGLGYGRELLETAECYARDSHAKLLRIGSLASNRRPRTLYQQAGFEEHAVLFQKTLQPDE